MKKKEFKIVLSEQVKKTLAEASEEDKKVLLEGIEKIRKNPYAGDPVYPIEVAPWENEICKCKKKLYMWMDKNDKEIYFNCIDHKCDENGWMTLKELEKGRKEFAKENKIKYKKLVEFIEAD